MTSPANQQGHSLALVMVVLLLAGSTLISGLQVQQQAQYTSAREWDHVRSFEMAQALLADAERDIQNAQTEKTNLPLWPRSLVDWDHWQASLTVYPNRCHQGLCASAAPSTWPRAHWRQLRPSSAFWRGGADYGQHTGASAPSPQALQGARYWVEVWPLAPALVSEPAPTFVYRITAVVWGQREGSHVVLQSLWQQAGGRIAWQELGP